MGQTRLGPVDTQLTRVAAELRHGPLASILALQRHDAQHTCKRGHSSRSPAACQPAHRPQDAPRNPHSLGNGGGTTSQEVRDCQHLWGNLGKPPPLALVPPGVRGADSPPSPAGPTGVNPSHPPSHAQHPFPCVSPAASALNAIQRQLAFTWFPQDVMEPARIPPIQAWDREGKPTSGENSVLEGPDAVAGAWLERTQMKHQHSIARDPQAQQSFHADGPGTTWRLLIPQDHAGGTFAVPCPLGGPG